MSWLSDRLGININIRRVVPQSFLEALEAQTYAKAIKQLDDEALRALSIALDHEWTDRKRKAGYE